MGWNLPFQTLKRKRKKFMKLSYYRNKCDKALQEKVARENKKCLLCGMPEQVGHHFFPKSVSSALRYDMKNIIPLCSGCHLRLHQSGDPTYETRIIEIKGEEWYEELQKQKRDYVKVNRAYYEHQLKILNEES